ncbi:uncharacterized protein LOC144903398 [Branchiostoma floridae x Branchiostoma belcheri]
MAVPSFGMQTELFQSVPFPPVVLWLVVSTLLAGIVISVCRRRSSRTPCSQTLCCNGTSVKIPTDSCHAVELSGTECILKIGEDKCFEQTINVACDCQCCASDVQFATCTDRVLQTVPLGLGRYRELLCTLIFMLLCEVTFHLLWREDALVGMAAVKFVQFMTVVLGVLFAHISLVDTAEGLTRLELGLRIIIQNKLACLETYLALECIMLYGQIAEVMFEVSENTLFGIIVIYICLYSSATGVVKQICLNNLFKFTIATQIPIIVFLTQLIVSVPLNTVFLIIACLWLMLSVTLFVTKIISAFRHVDDLHLQVQKESLEGVSVKA